MEAEVAYEQYEAQVSNGAGTPLFAALSQFNKGRAMDYARQLQVESYEQILQFGLPAQHQLKQLSTQMLHHIQRKDVHKVGEVLHDLMHHLEQIDPNALVEEQKGFFGRLFSKPKQSIQEIMTHYNRLSKRVDRLSIQLAHTQQQLLSDIDILNKLYELNEDYFHEINVYIATLQLKKQYLIEHEMPRVQQLLKQATDPLAEQHVKDKEMQLEWVDRRMYDLELSREIAIQYAPQIRLIQQTHRQLIDKIQSSVMTTIPMWQTQISLLLNMNNQRKALETQKRLMNASEEFARKSGKMIEHTANASRIELQQSNIERFKQTQALLLEQLKDSLAAQTATESKQIEFEATIQK